MQHSYLKLTKILYGCEKQDLNQFDRDNLWELVLKPKHQFIIGTKWVFRNKIDEFGVVVKNKARLLAQSYNQEE